MISESYKLKLLDSLVGAIVGGSRSCNVIQLCTGATSIEIPLRDTDEVLVL